MNRKHTNLFLYPVARVSRSRRYTEVLLIISVIFTSHFFEKQTSLEKNLDL